MHSPRHDPTIQSVKLPNDLDKAEAIGGMHRPYDPLHSTTSIAEFLETVRSHPYRFWVGAMHSPGYDPTIRDVKLPNDPEKVRAIEGMHRPYDPLRTTNGR